MHRCQFLYHIGGSLAESSYVEQVDTDKISLVVGPGGKTIRGIIESSGVESVDVNDDGSVSLPFSTYLHLPRLCLDYNVANLANYFSLNNGQFQGVTELYLTIVFTFYLAIAG